MAWWWLAGCGAGSLSVPGAGPGEVAPLVLVVDAPAYGAFVGDGPAYVSGSVSDATAIVWVEGRQAQVGPEGRFSVEVDVPEHYRVIDVEAARPDTHLRERRPVFEGLDPLATWPGALTVRGTPLLLDHLAEILASTVDDLDLASTFDGLVPAVTVGDLSFVQTGASVRPARATIVPSADGLALSVTLERFELSFEASASWLGTQPVVLGLDTVTFGATMSLGMDAGALVVGVSDTDVTLGDPILEFAGIDPSALESLAGGLTSGLGDLLEGALDLGALALGDFALPFGAFETDALGFPLSFQLTGVGTDVDGIGATLAVDVGAPVATGIAVPTGAQAGPQADVAIAMHEGLLQGLLQSDLITMLDLSFELPGVLGEIVALPIGALPGGEQLPADRTGMCLELAAGDSRVARLEPSLAPFGVLLLPDVTLNVGVSTPVATCLPWLDASLALEIWLDAVGTALETRIVVGDGAVLSYGAVAEYDEDDVVAGLGNLVNVAMSLLGTSLTIDFGELLGDTSGTALGELSPRLLDSQPVVRSDGTTVDGLMLLTVSLWD